MKRRCTNCAHVEIRAVGYSNYTAEGTEIMCTLHLNPDFPREIGWIDDPEIQDGASNVFAETCAEYTYGEPVHHAVECPSDCRDNCDKGA